MSEIELGYVTADRSVNICVKDIALRRIYYPLYCFVTQSLTGCSLIPGHEKLKFR